MQLDCSKSKQIMDVNISQKIKKEDVVGVLRTIHLFLDNIHFDNTSSVLNKECLCKGFAEAHLETLHVKPKEKNHCQNTVETSENTDIIEQCCSVDIKESLKNVWVECLNCKMLKNQLQELERKNHILLNITAELTEALQKHVTNQSENINAMLIKCKCMVPEMCKAERASTSKSVAENCKKITDSKSQQTSFDISFVHSECPIANFHGTNDQLSQVKCTTPNGWHSCACQDNHNHLENELIMNETEYGCTNNSKNVSIWTEKECTCEIKNEDTVPLKQHCKCKKEDQVIICACGALPSEDSRGPCQTEDLVCNSNASQKSYSTYICCGNPRSSISEPETIDVCFYPAETDNNPDVVEMDDSSASKSTFSHCCEVDFIKLKNDLVNGNVTLRMSLLQALRKRITKANDEDRKRAIDLYIQNDLLDITCNTNEDSVVERNLCQLDKETVDYLLQESMTRLVNTFASVKVGRDYLCQNDNFLQLLILLLTETHPSRIRTSIFAKDMLVATLQKLSLRNHQRMYMISSGLVEHLISFLSLNHKCLSSYFLEYSTALLMNLCLHKETREQLSKEPVKVITLLIDLMQTQQKCFMPYINGALYSLLSEPCINKKAKELKIEKVIQDQIEKTDGEIRQQLVFIQEQQLKNFDYRNCCVCPPIDPQPEVDLLEPELDCNDIAVYEPSGEALLKTYKICIPCLESPKNAKSSACKTKIQVYGTTLLNEGQNDILIVLDSDVNCVNNEKDINQNIAIDSEAKNGVVNLTPKENKSCLRQHSRSSSPDMAYSEENKQFYYIPSSKKGIFVTEKSKIRSKPPQLFAKTASSGIDKNKMKFQKPSCCQRYSTTLNYPVTGCYLENYKPHQLNKNKKYVCSCYKSLKEFVDKSDVNECLGSGQNSASEMPSESTKKSTSAKCKR